MIEKHLEAIHAVLPRILASFRSGKLGRRDFLRTATLLGLSAPTAYALAGGGANPVPSARAKESGTGTLRLSMNVMEASDPSLADWGQKGNLYRAVLEPLAKTGPDNITRPYLAERWSVNDDLTEWTFHLRHGVTWNNGDIFTAADVVANVETWRTEAHGSSNFSRFIAVESVEPVDDHTVRFHLSIPDVALPESLADYPALIAHRDFWKDGASFVDNPIGTGPFLLTDFAVGQRASLVRRSDVPWWGGGVGLDAIEIIDHGDDPSAHLAALASGQVDLLYEISSDLVPAVRSLEGAVLHEAVTGYTGVARMRVTEAPFDDIRVRQAIRACIDHAELLRLGYQDFGTPGEDHHVAPIHPEYAPMPPVEQDYDRARSLLAEAGYGDGLELEIHCVAQPTWEPNTCQVIAEMLRPAGISLDINIMPGGTYWDRWTEWPFGFTSWAHRPLGVQVLNLAYRSGVAWNESGYANPEFDAALDRAMGILDVDERRTVMRELQTMLQADSVIVQPFWRSIHTASSSALRGFALQPAREIDYPALSMS
ncbi:MAG: ABC transporter substrate-binding protein [Azospirillaceae bacterium]